MNLVKAVTMALLIFAAPAAESAEVTLLYNGSVRAELHDCGCKSLPLGGLARRAALVESICAGREALLVDAGNLLGDPAVETVAQSEFVARETAAMGYAAVGVGPYEFGHGIDFVQAVAAASDLEFLSANLSVDGKRPFAPWTVVERGGVRFGLISVVDPAYDRAPYDEKVPGLEIEDPVAALRRELPRLREECDVVVVLASMEKSDGTVGVLRALEEGPAIDIVVEGAIARQYASPRRLGDTLVLAANARGKYLGQLDLEFEGTRVVGTASTIHALALDLPESPDVARRVEEFESQQEQLAASR